jgi:hypothetical protein
VSLPGVAGALSRVDDGSLRSLEVVSTAPATPEYSFASFVITGGVVGVYR